PRPATVAPGDGSVPVWTDGAGSPSHATGPIRECRCAPAGDGAAGAHPGRQHVPVTRPHGSGRAGDGEGAHAGCTNGRRRGGPAELRLAGGGSLVPPPRARGQTALSRGSEGARRPCTAVCDRPVGPSVPGGRRRDPGSR